MICYKLLYLCKRSNALNMELGIYGIPEPFWVNYQPVSGYTNVMQYGERITKIFRAVLPFDTYVSIFHEGDLVYLCGKENEDGNDPVITSTYVNGQDANAIVRSVRNQNKVVEVTFEKLL